MDYVPNNDKARQDMLAQLGYSTISELMNECIPEEAQFDGELDLPKPVSELEIKDIINRLTEKNINIEEFTSFLGAGSYDHFKPAAIENLVSRPEFYTAYTPYQAEVSQGTLQGIFEFQSMITALTGMEIANASMYDGASALAEAAILALGRTRNDKILYSETINPLYIEVVKTYLNSFDVDLIPVEAREGVTSYEDFEKKMDDNVAAFLLQTPNFYGMIEEGDQYGNFLSDHKAFFVVGVDPISLGMLKPPAEYDADIVVGEGQSLGNPLYFGGPYLGFFAAKKKYVRRLPGRLSGMTVDEDGEKGFVLTLQTREQHIRREKATSNICTNQALMALRATIYLSLLGEEGFKEIAYQSFKNAHYLAKEVSKLANVELTYHKPFFKEFSISLPIQAKEFYHKAYAEKVLPGLPIQKFFPEESNQLLVSVTEKKSKEEIDQLLSLLRKIN